MIIIILLVVLSFRTITGFKTAAPPATGTGGAIRGGGIYGAITGQSTQGGGSFGVVLGQSTQGGGMYGSISGQSIQGGGSS